MTAELQTPLDVVVVGGGQAGLAVGAPGEGARRRDLGDGELEVHTGRVVTGEVAHRRVGASRQRHR